MPNRSSIVLTDGVTPVTLTPTGGSLGLTQYMGTGAATAAANAAAKFSYRYTSNGANRQSFSYKEPITAVDSTTGETYVRGNVIVDIGIVVPSICTPAQRLQAIKRAFSAIAAEALQVEFETGQGQW